MKSQNYCPEMYSEKNEVLSEESLKLNIHFPVAVRYVWLWNMNHLSFVFLAMQ